MVVKFTLYIPTKLNYQYTLFLIFNFALIFIAEEDTNLPSMLKHGNVTNIVHVGYLLYDLIFCIQNKGSLFES